MRNKGKVFCAVSAAVLALLVACDTTGIIWSKYFRPTGSGSNSASNSVAALADGTFISAGFTSSDETGFDAWLVKTDADGNTLWEKKYGGSGSDQAYSIVQTKDGGFMTAGFTPSPVGNGTDFWFIKTDAQGNQEWTSSWDGGDNDEALSVIQTSDGGYIACGRSWNSSNYWEGAIVKISSSGAIEWVSKYENPGDDVFHDIKETSDGFAAAGYSDSNADGVTDMTVVKLDRSGREIWKTVSTASKAEEAHSLVIADDGSFFAAGSGNSDMSAIHLSANGSILWKKYYGGTDAQSANCIIKVNDGYILFGSTGSAAADVLMKKIDSAGKELASRTFGYAASSEFGVSIRQTSDGGYITSGCSVSGTTVQMAMLRLGSVM